MKRILIFIFTRIGLVSFWQSEIWGVKANLGFRILTMEVSIIAC